MALREQQESEQQRTFQVLWLDHVERDPARTPSLLRVPDIDYVYGEGNTVIWLPSYGVSFTRGRVMTDLELWEHQEIGINPHQLERLTYGLQTLKMPAAAATYLALSREDDLTQFPVPSEEAGPTLLFGISGPPGRDKSTLLAVLAKRTGLPVVVLEPKYSDANAAAYLKWLDGARADIRLSQAKEVIWKNLDQEQRFRKKGSGSDRIGRVKTLREQLDRLVELFRSPDRPTWYLCDLNGWPRVKQQEYLAPPKFNRPHVIYDLFGQESLEYSAEVRERMQEEQAERQLDFWIHDVLDDTVFPRYVQKWEKLVDSIRTQIPTSG